MSQLATNRSFNEPPIEFAPNAQPPMLDFNHMLVLALEQALAPPIVNRRSIFQPMRVIVVNQGSPGWPGGSARPEAQMRELPARLLPQALSIPNQASKLSHRTVRGEILSDERGQLYEKLGRQIRPLHQLASGPSGEVIDLIPTCQSNTQGTAERNSVASIEKAAQQTSEVEPTANANSDKPAIQSMKQIAQPGLFGGYRKLFADPGQWRVIWWGEFKEILAGQLAHPERLRDSYRLPCYIQVIETERTVSIAELATVYKSEKEPEARLYVLTDEIAAKLDLILPLRPAPIQAAPNTLTAHQRVFRLLIANDPTLDVAALKNHKQPVSAKPADHEPKAMTVRPNSEGESRKETIPSGFVKEWEFKISREEASYDMKAKPTLGKLVLSFFRRMRFVKRRNELRKWQTLLAGKDADEQLWAVRPPTGFLRDSVVRDWAAKTLELGDYDSRKMMIEWEILWRRKGL